MPVHQASPEEVAYNEDEERLIEEARQHLGLKTREETITHLISERLRNKAHDMVGRLTHRSGKSKKS
jgi:hypothetical protein